MVVSDPKVMAENIEGRIFLLPYRLRLIRTAFGDNGFRGIRSVTSQVQFHKDLEAEAEFNKESGDFMPPEKKEGEEKAAGGEVLQASFSAIGEGEYMTISPGNSLKYLVCNPSSLWAVGIVEGSILMLCPVSQKQAKATFKGKKVVEVNAVASFV